MSTVTVSQAAALTGRSRETVNKATRNGRLSFRQNASNHKVIEIAELERVFPLVKSLDDLQADAEVVQPALRSSAPDSSGELALLRERLAGMERTYELIVSERAREREQLADEIDNLRKSLERMQEQHGRALLLITDQTKDESDHASQWEQFKEQLEQRLAEQETRFEKEQQELRNTAKQKIGRLQRDLETERSKTFWQKLFS